MQEVSPVLTVIRAMTIRRCGAERYSENCLERDPRGSGGWHYPGITEFYKADGSISGRDDGVYHGCGESGRDHYSGEDHWMYIADSGTDPSSGSGDHGGSVDLNHRRCMQSDRIFFRLPADYWLSDEFTNTQL